MIATRRHLCSRSPTSIGYGFGILDYYCPVCLARVASVDLADLPRHKQSPDVKTSHKGHSAKVQIP